MTSIYEIGSYNHDLTGKYKEVKLLPTDNILIIGKRASGRTTLLHTLSSNLGIKNIFDDYEINSNYRKDFNNKKGLIVVIQDEKDIIKYKKYFNYIFTNDTIKNNSNNYFYYDDDNIYDVIKIN